MAKTIKFNLICDGSPVRTIEDLREHFPAAEDRRELLVDGEGQAVFVLLQNDLRDPPDRREVGPSLPQLPF